MKWLRRIFCGHHETETVREFETLPSGVHTTRTVRHVCTRCGKDLL